MRLSSTIMALAAATFACGLMAGPDNTAMSKPASTIFRTPDKFDDLNGVWRSRGYGWLLEIDGGDVNFYDESASLCIKDTETSDNLVDMKDGFEISDDSRTIRLPLGDVTYQYTFDKIDVMPERCLEKADASPKSVFDALVDLFNRHYAFFKARNVDWQSAAEEARKKVTASTTSDELIDIVTPLLDRINDAHVTLETGGNGDSVREFGEGPALKAMTAQAKREGISRDEMMDRWQDSYWEQDVARDLLRGKGRTDANDMIQYGLIGEDIGYFNIRTMQELAGDDEYDEASDLAALDEAMDQAMEMFAGVEAIIVDVSMNDGGHDTVARRLAGRFAAKRTVGYYKYAGDADGDRPQAIPIEPSKGRRFTGPVYMITSNVTLSAAEIFTLAMRALPNVTQVGETTRGSLSDELWKTLPNDWVMSLSNEVYLDVQGRSWEGKGIPPEIPLRIFSKQDVMTGHVEAVRSVVEMARRHTSIDLTSR